MSDFDYDLPADSIAQAAIEPRDAARLLVTSGMGDRTFRDLPKLLRSGDVVVVNNTRVRAARLRGTRHATGGAVELLLTRRLSEAEWQGLVRPSRRIRTGVVISCGSLTAEVTRAPQDGVVTFRLDAVGDVEAAIAAHGEVPLPPYFTGSLVDPGRYQTMFATALGSAAASTAALHFTPEVVAGLARRGVTLAELDLEIGLDTFRPMTSELLAEHVMHSERYRVPDETVAAVRRTRDDGGRVVAVGTTVVRTLESVATGDGAIAAACGESDLFIRPGYRFSVVDAMITNFHAPRTTLIALVAAALGDAWRDVYAAAIARGYRFLSFGDAMLIEGIRRT